MIFTIIPVPLTVYPLTLYPATVVLIPEVFPVIGSENPIRIPSIFPFPLLSTVVRVRSFGAIISVILLPGEIREIIRIGIVEKTSGSIIRKGIDFCSIGRGRISCYDSKSITGWLENGPCKSRTSCKSKSRKCSYNRFRESYIDRITSTIIEGLGLSDYWYCTVCEGNIQSG